MAARRKAKVATGFKVGDRVLVSFGGGLVPAVITEDRGSIGYRGRRLFGVRAQVGVDPEIEMSYELPEEEIREAKRARARPPARRITPTRPGRR